jgi:hypothetical protein
MSHLTCAAPVERFTEARWRSHFFDSLRRLAEALAATTFSNQQMKRRPVRMHRTLSIAATALLALTSEGVAQVVSYESPAGHVEILGLHRWTLTMLRDSIRRYSPGQELHDAACMVTLRDQLHFAEASVSRFENAPPGGARRTYLNIKVIEPKQARRVQWDVRPASRADGERVFAFLDAHRSERDGEQIRSSAPRPTQRRSGSWRDAQSVGRLGSAPLSNSRPPSNER